MAIPERVLNDPRLVRRTIGGHDYAFWIHRRGYIAAEKQGYTPVPLDDEASVLDHMERIMRVLWVATLSFEPELSFEEFEMSFLPADYPLLIEAANEVALLQGAPDAEGQEEAEGE